MILSYVFETISSVPSENLSILRITSFLISKYVYEYVSKSNVWKKSRQVPIFRNAKMLNMGKIKFPWEAPVAMATVKPNFTYSFTRLHTYHNFFSQGSPQVKNMYRYVGKCFIWFLFYIYIYVFIIIYIYIYIYIYMYICFYLGFLSQTFTKISLYACVHVKTIV